MYDSPISPKKAIKEFLESKAHEVSSATIQNLGYRLKQFRLWADEVGINDMRKLDSRDCEQWKVARANADLSPVTMRVQLRSFKQFVRWCGNVGYCQSDLHERILVPTPTRKERSRDEAISFQRAKRITSYLAKYEYASRRHLVFGMIWHTAMRMGSLRALDAGDISWSNDGTMYLEVRHRPESNTPLKLGNRGERNVTVADDELASAIEDWVQHKRPDVTDEFDREPLIATRAGRASKSTIRCDVYRASHPCLTDECPHGKERETCRHVRRDFAGGCPSAVSPHPVRRSSITYHLDQDVPKEIVSERASVDVDTLEEHYDNRTQEQARTTRQQHIDDLRF